ncbi:prephenate dehydrogenase/arogenate dehydrogenase family protein [Candidimonas sp. SYP-B2681]|uniref:prephenate dehydrogenase n=1 Tax=Candidimonas sp. SYP-B2681 TaxID=2497686 RepID=UPI000F897768|nr:prephenate dehydrogenase/arogenate dehydrogenase family protein [Candidimonas sp. SYP-B2681]RTZ40987.1 prephenate dehydrogenase/arogenate dehydrogenase family protein [Candidimonas sp. SYP-B2681]
MSAISTEAAAATPLVPVLAVIGVGLIGGSFAAALRDRTAVGRVLGVGRQPSSLAQARELGLIDEIVSLKQAAEEADLIFLAMPVGAMESTLSSLKPFLRPNTLITDAGSTKANVVAAARAVLGDRIGQFIPAHPIAGAETTGPEAAQADLYHGRTVVLTPLDENTAADKAYLTRVWERCGARVMAMDADVHDTILASVSHVPHFLSSVFMWQVASAEDSDLRMALAGSGFRDFTRIAAGSPEVWRDIFLANRTAVLAEIQEVKAALSRAEQALQEGDGTELQDFLEHAALARRFWGSRSGLT